MKKIAVDASVMQDIMDYIKTAQATVEQYEALLYGRNTRLQEKVAHAVGCMIDKGLVDPQDRSILINELSQYPEKIAEALVKLSQKAELPPLGAPSGSIDPDQMDELTKLAFEFPTKY